ncbi:type 4a pilus biogenesis protein PilO [Curtobacterium sp. B18]|uniref:type 4a pilus biogenesis protein PilO n=1 Tax=Curtobacterium sp. B18 TaxID=95614 RepID=UPI0003452BB0|nr:type 4a pilus biogenesis protein PilO [Curtobacterium sp. B18]
MNKNRLSLIIALAATLVVLAGGWFLGAQPQLAQASDNTAQQADIDATNAKNRAELRRLETAYTSLDATEAELADLRASVPASTDTASLLDQFNGAGAASGVTVTSITIGDPKAYTPVTSAASATASATAAPSASPSASSSASPASAPTAAATPDAPAPHSDAQITASNFVVVPVTVAVKGSYDQAIGFTKAVQNGDRLFLVNGLAATSSDSGGDPMTDQSWSLSGYVYVLADPAATN